MAENQTVENDASVDAFLAQVEHPTRRDDARALVAMMRRVTGVAPKMWGPAIIGFGRMHYRYDSGREGDMPRVGFSPRKANLALYIAYGGGDYQERLARLGKHRTGVSCLYINRLTDVDVTELEALVARSWHASHLTHPEAP
jgi:hypothetical protein